MSVVSVVKIESEGELDAEGHRTYTSIYEVTTDDVQDGPITVMFFAPGLPAYRTPYVWGNDYDLWAFCQSIKPKLRSVKDTRKVWRVTVIHSSKPANRGDSQDPAGDPTLEPPVISGSLRQMQRPAERDRNGDPIVNSVEEPFIPAVMTEDSQDTVRVQINTASINLGTRANARDKVNSGTFWGLGARRIKVAQWAYEIKTWGDGNTYVKNTLDFAINYDGWIRSLLNQGFRKRVGTDDDGKAKYERFLDHRDQPLSQPRLLAADGTPLGAGDAPVYLDFEIEDEFNFGSLPVPNPLF